MSIGIGFSNIVNLATAKTQSGDIAKGLAMGRLANRKYHDAAVIIRGDHIVAAGCVLPLTAHEFPEHQYGTRHRAAIGVTEQTDAISVVVSEETGGISIARNGRMVRNLDQARLSKILQLFTHSDASQDF